MERTEQQEFEKQKLNIYLLNLFAFWQLKIDILTFAYSINKVLLLKKST